MRRLFSLFIAVYLLSFAAQADAIETLTQNTFTTAESLDEGMTQSGIFLSKGNHYVSYSPEFRYGLGSMLEVGAKVGAIAMDVTTPVSFGTTSKLSAMVGADLKYQVLKRTEDIPIDLAFDLGLDTTFISGDHVTELSFLTIVSRGFPLTEGGYKITPYGGVELSSQFSSSQYLEDETRFYAVGGLEWRLSRKFMLTAEIKAGSTALAGIGISVEY